MEGSDGVEPQKDHPSTGVTCRKHCVVQPFADYPPWCGILHFEKRHTVCGQVDPMVRRLFRQNIGM